MPLSGPFPSRCSPKVPRERHVAQRVLGRGVGYFAVTVNVGLHRVCSVMKSVALLFLNFSAYVGYSRIECLNDTVTTIRSVHTPLPLPWEAQQREEGSQEEKG